MCIFYEPVMVLNLFIALLFFTGQNFLKNLAILKSTLRQNTKSDRKNKNRFWFAIQLTVIRGRQSELLAS